MRLLDIGPQAEGVIAIGASATGLIAIGGIATGAIAIGPLARGGIAIGAGALGLFAFGAAALGLFGAAGLFAAGGVLGRARIGLPLVPRLDRRGAVPRLTTMSALRSFAGDAGWLRATVKVTVDGTPLLWHRGTYLDVALAHELWTAAVELARTPGLGHAFVCSLPDGGLRCTRLAVVLPPSQRSATWWLGAALQCALLAATAVIVWKFAALPAGTVLFGPGGLLR